MNNTHLVGFTMGNAVQLRRWGKDVKVPLPLSSIQKLRDACFNKLPTEPPPDSEKFVLRYEGSGVISGILTARQAELMLNAIYCYENDAEQAELEITQLALEHVVNEHRRAGDTKHEPGVPQPSG